jgi:catechol 2,3-dioxygenase-like lactoylglutathione lyase family enzyme
MPQPVLTHVAFNCPDIDSMAEFYRDLAGLEIVLDRRDGDLRVAWLGLERDAAPFLLVLLQRPGNQPVSPHAMEHLGFECQSRAEVDEIVARARKRGAPLVEGPDELPPPVGYFAIVADPNGNRVEFSCPDSV